MPTSISTRGMLYAHIPRLCIEHCCSVLTICSSPQAPTPRRSLFTTDLFKPRENAGQCKNENFETVASMRLTMASTNSHSASRSRACYDARHHSFVLALSRGNGHLAAATQGPTLCAPGHSSFSINRRDPKRSRHLAGLSRAGRHLSPGTIAGFP